jgi:para-aminobenzoate synthetase component 1
MLEVLGDPQGIKEALKRKPRKPVLSSSPLFSSNFSKAEYLRTVRALQQHIEEGDCYEINLSQIFTAKQRLELPEDIFLKLLDISPVPFAAMLKWDSYWLLCASPERFLQKKEDIIRTQPIKGTAARDKRSAQDKQNKAALRHSPKEQAENVMIVDLSRNDIYRVCKTNTVRVPDLFEIQAFPTVYQIVSTIEGRLDPSIGEVDIIEHIFPPGSMTGAPKVRTMELIDAYESDGRGMYAGSVGYFSPDGNFDFNVVIRALQYDDLQGKLAYQVGGAITWDSDPEAEYEETLLKAAAIRKIWE